MKIHRDPQVVASIIQGLLASGHYTEIAPDGEPQLKMIDVGDDFIARGYPAKFITHAVRDAFMICDELKDEISVRPE